MRKRLTRTIATLGAATAIGVSGATAAFASGGADDPPNHERHHHRHCHKHPHRRHCEPNHTKVIVAAKHGADDPAGHDRRHGHGHDDGPNHT